MMDWWESWSRYGGNIDVDSEHLKIQEWEQQDKEVKEELSLGNYKGKLGMGFMEGQKRRRRVLTAATLLTNTPPNLLRGR